MTDFEDRTYDVSKQIVGSAGIHILNLLLSIISSNKLQDQSSNPCDWYDTFERSDICSTADDSLGIF
jgi:hypothetical protein